MTIVAPYVLQLRNLEEGTSHVERVGTALDLELTAEQVEVTAPVVLRATVFRAGQKVEVQGHIITRIAMNCDRCLEPTVVPLDIPIRVFAERRESRDRRTAEEVREDDLGIVYHDGQSVDLTDEVRQLLLCEVPWHFVCKEDCLGLCPRCGVNRNQESCACPEPGGRQD